MLKKQKVFNSLLFLASITAALVLPTSAFANHKYSQQYGELLPYGHFGQPHGYVISGEFSFIVETKGTVDRAEFSVYKANETNLSTDNRLQVHSQTSVSTGSGGIKYFKLVWNSTGLPNGDYKLFANILCDSCSPNGWQDFVVHYDGKGYLSFKVDNPVVAPPPTSQPPEESCSDKLSDAKKIAGNIYEKHKTNMLFIDNFLQQTTLFYEKNNLEIEEYVTKQANIEELRKKVSDDIVSLEKQKNFSCDGNLEQQASAFLAKSEDTRNKLDGYKDSVIKLMLNVLEKA